MNLLSFIESEEYKEEKRDIVRLNKSSAKSIISKYHYLNDKGFLYKIAYGLYINDNLVGVSVFHGPSSPETVVGAFGFKRNEQEGIWELGRLVLFPEYNGKNYGSMLVSRSIKQLKKDYKVKAIISYAESERHYGAVYQASNFLYCGLTSQKSDFYINGIKKERGKTKGILGEWRKRPRKYRYVFLCDKKLKLLWKQENYIKIKKEQ